MARTSQKSNPKNYPVSISGPEDSRVKIFRLAASKSDLTETEVDYFLKLLDSQRQRT